MPSKDGTMDDKKKTTKDVVNKKQKQMMNQEEYLPEEEYDRYRDEKLMRGGDHRSKETRERSYSRSDDDKRKGDTPMQKEFKKKYGKKATALDAVKKDIEDKYGKGAIMKPKKKKKDVKEGAGLYANIHAKRKRGGKMRKKGEKGAPSSQDFANAAKTAREELDLTQVAEAFGGYIIVEKLGKEGEFIPDDPNSPFEKSFSRSKEGKKLKRQKKIPTSKNIPTQPGDAEATDNLIRQQQGKPKLTPKGQKELEKISAKSKLTPQKQKAFLTKLAKQTKAAKEGKPGSIDVGGTTVTNKQIRQGITTPSDDEGQFRRRASRTADQPKVTTAGGREVIGTTETGRMRTQKPTTPPVKQPQPTFQGFRDKAKVTTSGGVEAPKVMSDKVTGTKVPKRGLGRAYPGDAAYRQTKRKMAKQAVVRMKAPRKKVLRKLISSPAVRTRIARKVAGKVGGKFLAKRIPGVGAVISGAEALSKAAAGDFVGAGIAGAETVVGLIPGIGSVAGAGIGAIGAARDATRAAKSAKTLRSVIRGTQKLKTAKQLKTFKPAGPSMAAMKKYAFSPAERGSMMTGQTKIGRAGRAVAVSGGMDQMRKLNLRRPKFDTGVVGKITAG